MVEGLLMERYLRILYVNIRYNMLPHIIVCLLMIFFTPVIMGIEHLNQGQVAKMIEYYLSLIGILLLIPVFIPDLENDIYQLIRSKKEPVFILHILRMLESILIIALIGVLSFTVLYTGDCDFSWSKMGYSFMANAIFLGGLGMIAYSLSGQIVFAYMVPLIYYVINYGIGEKKLGMVYLFSMQSNHFLNKHYLLGFGLLFIVTGIVVEKYKLERKKGSI